MLKHNLDVLISLLFVEQVSHHPTLIACHSDGNGWKFWGDSNLRTKFWGTSIQLDPVGTLTLEFDDGEVFQWSKVCTIVVVLVHHNGMAGCFNWTSALFFNFYGTTFLKNTLLKFSHAVFRSQLPFAILFLVKYAFVTMG